MTLFDYLTQKASGTMAAVGGDNPVAAAEASGGGLGGWLSGSTWYVENRTCGGNGDFSDGGDNSGDGDGANLERLRPTFERLFQRYGLQDCPGWLRSKGLNDPDSTPK